MFNINILKIILIIIFILIISICIRITHRLIIGRGNGKCNAERCRCDSFIKGKVDPHKCSNCRHSFVQHQPLDSDLGKCNATLKNIGVCKCEKYDYESAVYGTDHCKCKHNIHSHVHKHLIPISESEQIPGPSGSWKRSGLSSSSGNYREVSLVRELEKSQWACKERENQQTERSPLMHGYGSGYIAPVRILGFYETFRFIEDIIEKPVSIGGVKLIIPEWRNVFKKKDKERKIYNTKDKGKKYVHRLRTLMGDNEYGLRFKKPDTTITYLDVGCNLGDLTNEIITILTNSGINLKSYGCSCFNENDPRLRGLNAFTYFNTRDTEKISVFGGLKPNSIDLISVFMVFHHLGDNFEDMLKQIFDKCKVGGYLFIKEHHCGDDPENKTLLDNLEWHLKRPQNEMPFDLETNEQDTASEPAFATAAASASEPAFATAAASEPAFASADSLFSAAKEEHDYGETTKYYSYSLLGSILHKIGFKHLKTYIEKNETCDYFSLYQKCEKVNEESKSAEFEDQSMYKTSLEPIDKLILSYGLKASKGKFSPESYFPPTVSGKRVDVDRLNTTSVSDYSSTPYTYMNAFKNALIRCYGTGNLTNMTVVDVCACIGSDSIKFIRLGANVISIELDSKNCRALRSNLDYLDPDKRHKILNGNCVQILSNFISIEFKPEIIYFDPPWSSPGHKYVKVDESFVLEPVSYIEDIDLSKNPDTQPHPPSQNQGQSETLPPGSTLPQLEKSQINTLFLIDENGNCKGICDLVEGFIRVSDCIIIKTPLDYVPRELNGFRIGPLKIQRVRFNKFLLYFIKKKN